MALSEQRILNQVSVLPNQNAINVQWSNQVLRDGEVISQTFVRKAYSQGQRAEFETEVEGAAAYVSLINWDGGAPAVSTVPQVISKRQAKLALLAAGLLDTVEAAVAAANREIQIEWADATEFRRSSPTIATMQAAIGLTDQQVDDLFVAGYQL